MEKMNTISTGGYVELCIESQYCNGKQAVLCGNSKTTVHTELLLLSFRVNEHYTRTTQVIQYLS